MVLAAPHAAAPIATATSAREPAPGVSQAARIEDAAVATTSSQPPEGTASSSASPFAKLASAEPSVATKTAVAAKRQPGKPTNMADAKRRQPRDATAKLGGSNRTARAVPAAPTAATKLDSGADADVAIMTALMNHMNETNAGAGGSSNPSIADLVRRCRGLPAAEAQACQRRICQGYWGRAEACPRERQTALRTTGPASP